MTQPTLSRQMAQLEEELGTPLFIRGKHLALTDAGVMLRRRAEEVVSLINKIESEFEEQNEVGGIISIGSGGLSVVEFLLPAMQSFREKYPRVQFQFYTNSAEYVKERLDQGLLDFGRVFENQRKVIKQSHKSGFALTRYLLWCVYEIRKKNSTVNVALLDIHFTVLHFCAL